MYAAICGITMRCRLGPFHMNVHTFAYEERGKSLRYYIRLFYSSILAEFRCLPQRLHGKHLRLRGFTLINGYRTSLCLALDRTCELGLNRYCVLIALLLYCAFINSSLYSYVTYTQVKEMVNLNLFIDSHYKYIVSIIRVKLILTLHLSTAN